MKKLLIAMMALVMLFANVATADAKQICGVVYRSYGILNQDSNQDSNVYYDVNWLGVAAGVVLAGTVIVPAYVVGFSLMRPVGLKRPVNCHALKLVR